MADQATPWPLQFLVLLPLLLFPTSKQDAVVVAAVLPGDADALMKFKQTLASGGGDALRNWVPGSSPCEGNASLWTGVICNFDGSVHGLTLENMSLTGSLSADALANLPALRTLSFMHNDFYGPIPDLTKFHALRSIYLSMNRFSGEVPDGMFAGMQWLKKLHLSQNGLTGRIPSSLASAARLLEVRLDENKFEGRIPDLRQPGLSLLNVSYNNLYGPIPARLTKMSPSWFEGNEDLCGAPLSASCQSAASNNSYSPSLIIAVILLSIAILLALLAVLLILHGRRKAQTQTNVHPSSKSIKMEQLQIDPPENSAVQHHEGGKKAVKDEQGKLIFVKEVSAKFGIQDLLTASAEVLGSGNFGSSYKAILLDGPAVVVKRFKEMNGVGREDFQEHMRRLGRLSHPNLLPLLAYYYRKEEKLLVADFIPNGSLAHMLHGNRGTNLPPLDWPTRLKIVKGVARGLAYLYEELPMMALPHGHLKSSNVLMNYSFDPILSDYALVPVMIQAHASEVMVAFKSPEYMKYGRPSKKSDVWSFGILVLEVLTGKFPANYLRQGRVSTDLASWVSLVVKEERTAQVFDENMTGTEGGDGEMVKLLHIALACCEADVDKRCELSEALASIDDLKEHDEG